jgi:nucleoprotein TPR
MVHGLQEKIEMELKKHTDEAASKVAAVLQRAEEQGHMIESLHTSVSFGGLTYCA